MATLNVNLFLYFICKNIIKINYKALPLPILNNDGDDEDNEDNNNLLDNNN